MCGYTTCGTRQRSCGCRTGFTLSKSAKWLGHSSYVLTLTTYADYITEQEAENPLSEPVAAVAKTNVVPLRSTARGAKQPIIAPPAMGRNVCCTDTPPSQRNRVEVLCDG